MEIIISLFLTIIFLYNVLALVAKTIVHYKVSGVEIMPEQVKERAQYAYFPLVGLPVITCGGKEISTIGVEKKRITLPQAIFLAEENIFKRFLHRFFLSIFVILERKESVCRAYQMGVIIQEPWIPLW